MAAVLIKRNESVFGAMSSNLHRSSASAASSTANPCHGTIGSGMLGKTPLSPESLTGNASKASTSKATPFPYAIASPNQAMALDGRVVNQRNAAILMRKLPRNLTQEALRSMLLFAKDLVEVEFVPKKYDEDSNFLTAMAHFTSLTAAEEARAMLDGKPNSTGQANMIVELQRSPANTPPGRRNTVEHGSLRGLAQSISPPGSMAPGTRQSSRFNEHFQSLEKSSSAENGAASQRESSTPDATNNISGFFSPQSPIADGLNDRQRQTGKAMINEGTDDDTGAIIKNPMAFMNNDYAATSSSNAPRRQTNSQIPINRFNSLSLATEVSPPPTHGFSSPRSALNVNSPSTMSPHIGIGQQGFSMSAHAYSRHNYPPVNPADQNPPCNTLYVGNLPLDTSEDELKALFSKQRGYKRLCFRTKHNGPMCFVEFEDVSFATKTLTELYGINLHNSVKGGIRLSFSKNPLGVRSGQPGSANPTVPLAPQSAMSPPGGLSAMPGQNFVTASGPPPGLSAPPGLSMPATSNGSNGAQYSHPLNPMMSPMGYSHNPAGGVGSYRGANNGNPGNNAPSNGTSQNGGAPPYPGYMLGR